jgi:hypothetical protein
MKSSITRKVQALLELDFPLLVKNNFIFFGDSDREKELNTPELLLFSWTRD